MTNIDIVTRLRNIISDSRATEAAVRALGRGLPAGCEIFVVGGAVRDVVLGREPNDVDLLVTGATADDIRRCFDGAVGKLDLVGASFGVFHYRHAGEAVEIAQPRVDDFRSAGVYDTRVDPALRVEDDLARRDFTINAMAVSLADGRLVDPHGGVDDLRGRVLRTVDTNSFWQDPTRMLRVLTAYGRGLGLPSASLTVQLQGRAHLLDDQPRERLGAELIKIMESKNPAAAMWYAQHVGLMPCFLPEVCVCFGFDQQNKWHDQLLDEHLLSVLAATARLNPDPAVRLAAYLHDVGKPASQWIDDAGQAHYYENEHGEGQQHEEVGAVLAGQMLTRLRLPNGTVQRVKHLIRHHMFAPARTLRGARRFVARVGEEHAGDLLDLRWADNGAKEQGNPTDFPVFEQRGLVQRVISERQPTSLDLLAVNGRDVIEAGVEQGPEVGRVLQALVDLVVDDPALNDPDLLLAHVRAELL